MQNPLLPDPSRHPRLYAREYQRLRPLLADLALVLSLLACLPSGWLLWWCFRLAFAL